MGISTAVQATGASPLYLHFSTPGHEIFISHSKSRKRDSIC